MRHRHKEVREPFNKAESFGCRVEDWGKNVVIFPPDQTVQSHIAQNEGAFHETPNPVATCSRTPQHRRDSNDILKGVLPQGGALGFSTPLFV